MHTTYKQVFNISQTLKFYLVWEWVIREKRSLKRFLGWANEKIWKRTLNYHMYFRELKRKKEFMFMYVHICVTSDVLHSMCESLSLGKSGRWLLILREVPGASKSFACTGAADGNPLLFLLFTSVCLSTHCSLCSTSGTSLSSALCLPNLLQILSMSTDISSSLLFGFIALYFAPIIIRDCWNDPIMTSCFVQLKFI